MLTAFVVSPKGTHFVMMNYRPKPIDISGIELTPDLVQLTERLAENAHDLWASQRFAQGWTYGPQRDDTMKRHPCLVPYEELSEKEKEYDRITALGTLKAIMKLGYRVLRRNASASSTGTLMPRSR
jgi:hypothetical protein